MMWHNNFSNLFSNVTVSHVRASVMESEVSLSASAVETGNISGSILAYPQFCANLQEIGSTYNKVHGSASIAVCIFGTVANILNFLVLTRKEMINSTNAILTGLAISDLLNLVEYVPYAIYTDFLPDLVDGGPRKTYPWAVYVLIHSNFSQVCHTISIWLTVTIAAWRYFMISMPLQSRVLCSMQRAKLMVALAYCITPILCVPIYFTFSVQTVRVNQTAKISSAASIVASKLRRFTTESTFLYSNVSSVASTLKPETNFTSTQKLKYIVNLSNLSIRHPTLVKANFWIYSVVLKIIPCILLTVVSLCLINSLVKAKRRKEMLLGPLSTAAEAAAVATANKVSTATCQKSNNLPGSSSGAAAVALRPPAIFANDARIPEEIPLETFSPPGNSSRDCAISVATSSQNISTCQHNLTIEHTATSREPSNGNGHNDGNESENTSSVCGIPLTNSNRPSSSLSTSGGDIYLTTRTTRMLLTVLILFLITEFPQGILALFSAIMGQEFFKRCYIPMANLMDFLALLNCSINFILYCFMSKRFRDAFCRMLRREY